MVDVVVGRDTSEVTVDVPVVGALVRVRVPGTPGGYLWQVSGLQGRVGVFDVRTVRDGEEGSSVSKRPIGGVPDREFMFTTGGAGEAYAILTLARPWEDVEPLQHVDVTFRTAALAAVLAAPAAF